MRVVRPLLAPKVGGDVAATAAISGTVVIARWKALHRCPGFDQRTIDAEMIAREKPAGARPVQDRGQKFRGDLARQQLVAVLGKGRVVPYRIVDAEPHEPAEQQVKLQPLRAYRIEGLQQHRAKQHLRRDRGAPQA